MFTARKKAHLAVGVVAAGALFALAGCATSDPTAPGGGSAGDGNTIIVGSFNFPESEILGEIYLQSLDAAGFDVESSFNLGPRQTTIPALEDGSVNLMPEYNGNLVFYYDEANEATTTEELSAELEELIPDGFQVLEPSPAEDKDAYVVTQAKADEVGLETIGDLSKLEPFSLGSNPQFGELPYGIPGLAEVYGVTDVTFVPIEDYGGPDTVKALVDDAVQVADIYTTSPALVQENLLVLEDPENLIAAQNVTPMLNSDIYTDELAEILNEISAAMTTDDLIALRDRVEGDEKAQPSVAAEDWLTEKGLL